MSSKLLQLLTGILPENVKAKLDGRDYLLNIIKNTGWLFVDNVLRLGVGLFVGIWVARYLGPIKYGLFSYSLAFAAIFSSLSLLGLDDVIVRDLVKDRSRSNLILGTCFALKIVSGAFTFCLTMAAIYMLRSGDRLVMQLVCLIAAGNFFQAFTTIEHWFNAQVQSKYVVWAKGAAFTLCSIIKVGLIVAKASLIAFAWIALIEVAAGSVALLITYRRTGNICRKWRANLSMAGELLKDSWPLLFSNLVFMVYMRIDQVMIGQILDSQEVGIYSVAVRLGEVWFFIPQIIFTSVYPSIVEAKAISNELMHERMQKLFNLMTIVSYLIAVPVSLVASPLVVAIFGSAYERAGLMTLILVWGNLFNSLDLARCAYLMAMNWTRIIFMTLLGGAIVNVSLNLLLIPRYGGLGAAAASLVSYWFAAYAVCFLFRPLNKTAWMMTRALVYPKLW